MDQNGAKFVPRPIRVSEIRRLQTEGRTNKPQSINATVWHVLKETFYEYAEMSKVNGMYYLRKNVTSGFPRLLWVLIIGSLFSLGVVLVILLWRKYVDSPTRMTVASEMSILQVPYPGITICHPQSVMDYKAEKLVDKL